MPLRNKLLLPFCLFSAFVAFTAVLSTCAETFKNPRRIPLPYDPYGVATGDVNGDGRNDIIWLELPASSASPALHVLLANANGQYSSSSDLALPIQPAFLQCVVEDVTGDRNNDLICSAVPNGSTSIFLYTYPGRGDGTFAAPVVTQVATQETNFIPVLVSAGDLNGDGRSDVIVVNSLNSGTNLPYLSDGQGGFTAAASFATFITSRPIITDLNGDGKLDVLWPAGPIVNLGNGDGTFAAPVRYDPGFLSNCAFGDVDGDGHLDAACTWFDGGDIDGYVHLTVLHGNRDGSFSPTPLFTRTFGNGENGYDGLPTIGGPVFIADLNGDGYADIVSTSGDGYCVLLGGANSTWSSQPRQFVSVPTGPGNSVSSIADMNGDGLPDFTAIGLNGLYIIYAQQDGTLASAPATEVGQLSTSATLVDVNGDGNLDVVSAGDNDLKLSLGHGDGTFASPQPVTTEGNFGMAEYVVPVVVSGDFDGDGKQDLLATGNVAGTAENYILFGNGDGTFEPATPIDISLGKVADVDKDGLSDVYAIQNNSTGTNALVVSLSDGDGFFKTVSTNLPSESVGNGFVTPLSGPALADFRHSGTYDVAVASLNNAYVLAGHGDGTFDSTGTSLPIPDLPNLTRISSNDVATGDFDGDGNADVAVLVQYGTAPLSSQIGSTSAVWIFYGHGDGTFSVAIRAGVFDRDAQTLTAGDLNGDGLADLVLTSNNLYQDIGVMIVHSLPNRTWGTESDYTGGEGLSPLWITDINHDGHNDLIFANGHPSNYPSNSVAVLLNDPASSADGSLIASPEPSNVTYPFTLTATFTPSNPTDTLSGIVTFSLDGAVVGTGSLSSNSASLDITGAGVPAGPHSLSASWPGDSTHPALTLNGSHIVSLLPLAISIAATPTSLVVGDTVTATVAFTPGLTPNPPNFQFTGIATLSDNGVGIAQQQASSNGLTFSLPALAIGTHALTIAYPGDALFAATQSNSVTVTVTGAPTVATLTATPATSTFGTALVLTAAVTSTSPGTITGTVSFYADGNLLNSAPVANGIASLTIATLLSGMHSLTCSYAGDKAFAASACSPVSVTVNNAPTAVTLVSSVNPVPALSSVTFTANLAAQGKPLASAVLFSIDGGSTTSVSTGANGNASYTTNFVAGTHTVKAQFVGSSGYDASSTSLTETAVPNPTTTTLPPPASPVYQSQPFAILSVVNATTGTSSPNGTLTLSEGATVLAQAVVATSTSGATATTYNLAVPPLTTGQHLLLATYTPADGNFLASTSQPLSLNVIAQSFTLTLSDPTLSIPTEHYKSFSATLQSFGAFNAPVRLSCAVPQNVYLTCSLSQSVLALAVNGSATSELTLDTDALLRFKSSLESRPFDTAFRLRAIAVALLLPLPLGFLRRRGGYRLLSLMLLLSTLGATLSLTGCGNRSPGHTPPGSYDVVVTATGTSAGLTVPLTQTAHLQLTVTAE